MEVGEERAGAAEFVAGVDEDIGLAGEIAGAPGGLDGARAGCADGYYAARGADLRGFLGCDVVALGVEVRVFDALGVQRLEGAQADVQRDVGDVGAGAALVEDLRREVQAGGGGGDGAALAGEDGLVALAVGGAVAALDVGRQRDVAGDVQFLPEVARLRR